MKIAIQGHPIRGKEIIQILESLGGKNTNHLRGNNCDRYYCILGDNHITSIFSILGHKVYTLEKFEKEFPFKIGDKVIHDYNPYIGTIVDIKLDDNIPYRVNINGTICTCETKLLHLYKPMKEERNITLTLEKAKEWYKKGGELKEVALQAYSEEELTKVELPKTWEEFCKNHSVKKGECWIGSQDAFYFATATQDRIYKYWIPSKKSAEAHLALIQLEQLRNCYNNNSDAWGWSYSIIKRNGVPELVRGCDHDTFLRFKNETIAIQFLKNFKDLIEKAGDLI